MKQKRPAVPCNLNRILPKVLLLHSLGEAGTFKVYAKRVDAARVAAPEEGSGRKEEQPSVYIHAVKTKRLPVRGPVAKRKVKSKKQGYLKKRSATVRVRRRKPKGKIPAGGAGIAGAAAGRPFAQVQLSERERRLQASRSWSAWWNSRGSRSPKSSYIQASRNFARGFYRGMGRPAPDLVLFPTDQSVSAVIAAQGASPSISGVLDQLHRLPLHEIIVVMSGPVEGIWQRVRAHPSDPVLLYYPDPLGFEAGRAVGAKAATSDIILFVDGHSPVRAEELVPFIRAVAQGTDIALNRYTPGATFGARDPSSGVAEFLNLAQGRRDLGTASLNTYPHAFSRRAVEQLGVNRLPAAPAAQALAVISGLQVTAPSSVPVRRPGPDGRGLAAPAAGELLYGDFMEAFWEFGQTGQRGSFPDHQRKRDKVKEVIS